MSETLIASLQKRIDELSGQVATLNAEGKDRRKTNAKLKADLEAATTQVAALTRERDDFRTKAEAGPADLTAKIAQLEGEKLARGHRDAFAGVREFAVKSKGKDGKDVESKYALNDGVTIEDVWSAAQYKPEGDAPDGTKVTGLYGQVAASKPFLFKPVAAGETPDAAPGGATTAIRTSAATAGPGVGRSASTTSERASAAAQVDAVSGTRPAGRIA